MTTAQKRFLLLDNGVGSVVVNLFINAVIAALMFRGAPEVPLWGLSSIAGDTIGTGFFLPLITSLIVTPLARRAVHDGRVETLGPTAAGADRMPKKTLWRGALLGVVGVLAVAVPTVVLLIALGVTTQRYWSFVAFKALFAAALGAVATPLIAVYAIAGYRPERGA